MTDALMGNGDRRKIGGPVSVCIKAFVFRRERVREAGRSLREERCVRLKTVSGAAAG